MENAPAVKTNEANLEELNKKIVEIKRKIVLKGEPLIFLTSIPCSIVDATSGTKRKFLYLMTCLPSFLYIPYLF